MMGFDLSYGAFAVFGLLLQFAVQVGIVLLALSLWERFKRIRGEAGPDHQPPKSPLKILDERYARGEIDAAKLEQRRGVLRGDCC